MNSLGFRRALVSVVSLLLLLSLLITIVLSNQILTTTTSGDLKESILNSATYESYRIAGHVEKSAKTVLGLADLYKNYSQKIALEDIIRIAAVAGSVHKVTIGFEDGSSYASKHDTNFPGGVGDITKYDPRTRPWFKLGRVSRGLALSDVFFTTRDQEPMLGAVHPIDQGTLLVDIRLNHMHSLLKEMKVVDGAVGFITNGEGIILSSTAKFAPRRKNINELQAMAAIAQSVFDNDNTFHTVNIEGKENVLVSKRINLVTGATWFLIITVDNETAFEQVSAASLKLNSSALIVSIISIVVLLIVLRHLYKPLLKLKETVKKLADGEGDLTSRLDVNSHDDLGDIAEGINAFIKSLQMMMVNVHSMTTKLSEGVNVLRAEEQQSTDILSAHLSETDLVVTAMEELSCSAKQVSEHAENAVTYTNEADTVADTSKGSLVSAQQSLQTLVDEVGLTTENVTIMDKETQDISSILSIIGGIAEQTNLLALNAAIEAARAGEQGRGFAVVADEVRALAGKTQQSTSEIETALTALKGGASSVVMAIERTGSTGKNAVAEAGAVAVNLGDLTDYVTKINDLSGQISTSAHEQNTVIQEINRNMSRIHNMVEELNAKGQSMRNETANIEAINQDLTDIVGTFKLH